MRVAGALFDLDGTLVHTRIDFAAMKRAVLALVAAHGVDPEPLRARDVLAIVTAARELAAANARAELDRACEAAIVDAELAALDGAAAARDAEATLTSLRARGVRVGIVTRNSRAAVSRMLQAIPLPHDVLLTRNDVARPKPDPSHLLEALARLGVAPRDAVMIGDHPMDVTAGRAAGLRTIAIAHAVPHAPAHDFTQVRPDAVVTSFAELRGVLDAL